MKGKTILLIFLAGVFVAIVRALPYRKSKIFTMNSFDFPETFEINGSVSGFLNQFMVNQ
jgi:hypothetical protein